MSEWKPPPFGTPVWMAIPATDVARDQPETYPKDKLRMFDLNPGLNLSGGIMKVPDKTGVLATEHGGICINWLVQDVEAVESVVEGAGGKMLSEKEKEGEHGMYRYFEDTEGNVGAVYAMTG